MVNALIDGESLPEILKKADGRLKADRKKLMESMDEELPPSHRIVLKDIRDHIDFLNTQQQALEVEIN